MIRAISARLVTNGSAEELKGLDVTLAGEQHARAAVVPDRARGSFAVAGLDLSQVVVTEQELDALAWTAGGVAGEARIRAKLAASSSARSRRGIRTPPWARAFEVARRRRERRRAEKRGRQRSASSAGATK